MTKIAREDVHDILELTAAQRGILVHYLKEPGAGLYHEQLRLDLEGDVDEAIFVRAWGEVVAANEMLRAVFRWEEVQNPVQIVLRRHLPDVRCIDLRAVPDREAALARAIEDDAGEPFDLRRVPFRVRLFRVDDRRWTLLKTFSHILYDGWSTRVVLGEFLGAYDALRAGRAPTAPPKARFRDHVLALKREDPRRAQAFWTEYLRDLEARPLPPMRGHDVAVAAKHRQARYALPASAATAVRSLAQAHRLTQAQILYVAWGLLLQKYTGAEDCVFGTVVSGREAGGEGVDAAVGLYINALPMRLRCRRSERLSDVLARVGEELARRDAFASTPLAAISRMSGLERDQVLVDNIFAVQNFPFDAILRAAPVGFRVTAVATRETSEFPLGLAIAGSGDLDVEATFQEETFAEPAVRQLVHHLGRVLTTAGERPDATVGELIATRNLVGEARWTELTQRGVAESAPPADVGIARLIERQVAATPGAIATVYGGETMTYAELDVAAETLARRLRSRGARPETFVGLALEQGLARIVAMFATAKTGAAYVPFDPASPAARIAALLEDCGAILLVADGAVADELGALPCPVLRIEDDDAAGDAPVREVDPRNALCVIYTSGSTGSPKGVVLENRSAVNTVRWYGKEIGIEPGRAILMLTDYTFDPHIEDVFGVLIHGGTVHLAPKDMLLDPYELADYLEEHEIYMINGVPSLLRQHVGNGRRKHPTLRVVISGGERIEDSLKQRILDDGYTLFNVYGPTECTVDAFSWRCDSTFVHLGGPIPNVQGYILESPDELALDGVVGELAISGRCLARGYLGYPDRTAERFVPHPFLPGERLYLSGDLGRRRFDGAIEFVGRADGQVKLRGFRIELGEIETTLLRHPDVREAVVIVRDDAEDQNESRYLCAYIVAARAIEAEALQAHLATTLPAHMVPACFVFLDTLPLKTRGKVDRSRLPAPRAALAPEAEPTDLSPTERVLTGLWAEVLGLESGEALDRDKSFFDVGGHSVSAMRLAAAIERELGKHIAVPDLFRAPTIRELAALLDAKSRDGAEVAPIPAAEPRPHYPVSSLQKRVYATAARLPESTVYNMTGGVWIDGALDAARLGRAFEALVARHEGLRTVFEISGGDVVQRVLPSVPSSVERRSIAGGDVDVAVADLVRPFDLASPPLARLTILDAAPARHLVVLDVHHIVADAASCAILVRELLANYRGDVLPPLRVQGKDRAAWMLGPAQQEALAAQQAYWKGVLSGATRLTLPTDRPRKGPQRHRGASLGFATGADRHAGLDALARAHGATLFMTTLATFAVALEKLSGRHDLVVGTPVEGRRHPDLAGIVGLLLNMLPLRLRPDPARSFVDFLGSVKESVTAAFEHQEISVEDLVLDAGSDAPQALFDVVFAYERGAELAERKLEGPEGWRVTPYVLPTRTAKFDLQLTVTEEASDLACMLDYDADLFLPETITNLRDKLLLLVDAIVRAPHAAIADLDWRTDFERTLAVKADVDFVFE